jgi:hypothetical protein
MYESLVTKILSLVRPYITSHPYGYGYDSQVAVTAIDSVSL